MGKWWTDAVGIDGDLYIKMYIYIYVIHMYISFHYIIQQLAIPITIVVDVIAGDYENSRPAN